MNIDSLQLTSSTRLQLQRSFVLDHGHSVSLSANLSHDECGKRNSRGQMTLTATFATATSATVLCTGHKYVVCSAHSHIKGRTELIRVFLYHLWI